jgi:hypothetical protein
MGIRNTLAFEETEEGTKRMFARESSSRSRFLKKLHVNLELGHKCMVEEDDYFKE